MAPGVSHVVPAEAGTQVLRISAALAKLGPRLRGGDEYVCGNDEYRCDNDEYRCDNDEYRCDNDEYRCRNDEYLCGNDGYFFSALNPSAFMALVSVTALLS